MTSVVIFALRLPLARGVFCARGSCQHALACVSPLPRRLPAFVRAGLCQHVLCRKCGRVVVTAPC
eukprot:8797019-Lingulodinium_polyedra.AAC.1